MRKLSMLMAMVLFALSACKQPTDYPVDRWKDGKTGNGDSNCLAIKDIMGQEWKLVSFEEFGKKAEMVPAENVFTLVFNQNGNAGGMADCNSYGASYTSMKPGEIKFTNYISTEAYCGPLDMRYSKAFELAESYWTDGKTLLIEYDKGTKRLNYKLSKSTSGLNLLKGTSWQLVSFEQFGITKDVVSAPEDIYINFDGDNYAVGRINCDTLAFKYSIGISTNNSLDIPFSVSDLIRENLGGKCSDIHGDKFTLALQAATSYFIYEDQLQITYATSSAGAAATRMNFVRRGPAMIKDSKWTLIDLNGLDVSALSSERYTLELADNPSTTIDDASGTVNCNTFTANFVTAFYPAPIYNVLQIFDYAGTKKACPNDKNTILYTSILLDQLLRYEVQNNELILSELPGNNAMPRYLRFIRTN